MHKYGQTFWELASGGALELGKCSCHLVVWGFADTGDPVMININDKLPPLEIIAPLTGEVQRLKFLSPYEAHKTLGHYKEPAGLQVTQAMELQKSDESTAFLWKCQLTPVEAWTYYFACYLPSIGYPLAVSTLTYVQLDRVQRTAMSIIIAENGYNRHTKREIIYGPLNYEGANFQHLYMEQGVCQTTTFIRHWRQQFAPGKSLKCALAWHHLSVGMSNSILSRVHDDLPHCESVWILSLRTFLATINATIEVNHTGISPPQRIGDEYIMDLVLASGVFTRAQTRRVNYSAGCISKRLPCRISPGPMVSN